MRLTVRYQVCLSTVPFGTGEGTLLDLSLEGCRIQTTLPLPVNTYLELRISTSTDELPILVDLAAVRWVDHQECGIEFLAVHQTHVDRLKRLLEEAGSADT
ncbi:MAG TPA: PilZ domain-containing protein [Nitrospiraceae bacterium]|jgi:hypothetical protein|nr:PilZ domain-containing protein [Nitrospiraceae bacterium]